MSLDMKSMSDEQLVHRGLQFERELMKARFSLHTQQLEDTSSLKKLRRNIARVQTQLRERERAGGLRKNALRDRYAGSFSPAEAAHREKSAGMLAGIVDKIKGSE